MKNNGFRFSSAVFDLETTSLDAVGAGVVLCCVVKPLGENPKILRYDDMHLSPGNDKLIVRAIVRELSQYNLLVGHNAIRYDWNFIKSRAIRWNIPLPTKPFVYDTRDGFRRCGFLTVPNIVGKPSCSLDMCVDFFGVQQRKTKIYPREHWKTVWGSGRSRKEAMNGLVDHCVADVINTEEIFPLILNHDPLGMLRRVK